MGFAALEIGKRALLSQRFGLDVTSNNIANSNTPGYSRREATFKEATPYYSNSNFIGTGVVVDKLRTFREEFFDREIRSSLSRKQTYETDERMMQRVEAIMVEPSSENGINNIVAEFLQSFDELALKPESVPHREAVLGVARTLVDRLNKTSENLIDARNETLQDLTDIVRQSNEIIQDIRNLNMGISADKSMASENAQTMVDRREERLEQLAKISNVNVTQNTDGTVNVYMNGINVVTGSAYGGEMKLFEQVNSITGERTAKIATVDKNDEIMNYISPDSGEMASLLRHYNETLDDRDSSGNFSVPSELNKFVNSLVQKVNGITTKGYGLDDPIGSVPGRNFFEPSIGTATAATIKLSSDIDKNSRAIPLSARAGEAGDATIARQIARIFDDTTFLNSNTPSEFYTDFIGKIGIMGKEASTGFSTARLVNEQLTNQRESIIGVNLDEEAVNLIKFQQAFEAASRIVNTTNEMLTTIVNLGR